MNASPLHALQSAPRGGRMGPAIERGLDFLGGTIRTRLEVERDGSGPTEGTERPSVPRYETMDSPFARFVTERGLSADEQLIVLLALAPHVRPGFLDAVISEALPAGGDYPQIGGLRGRQFRGFLPTAETALFLLAGDDLDRRFEVQELLGEDHAFAEEGILRVDDPKDGEPPTSGRLVLARDYLDLFTRGRARRPRFSTAFPAERITTEMEWEDLVLPAETMNQIEELEEWLEHGDTLLFDWGMKKRLKPGFRALFHGAPGTGKTLTASLLGKYTGRDVYRVDLSMIVSKFIGETEKNLARLFDRAEHKGWVLFFDEADALFSKRTNVRDAHDKYANQEVAYLLQRVEGYNGLVILASNLKSNIDEAFMRRFQSIVQFPVPRAGERARLWEKAFPDGVDLEVDADLEEVARRHELTGAGIMNVAQYCCLRALAREDGRIDRGDIERGIRREMTKKGKLV